MQDMASVRVRLASAALSASTCRPSRLHMRSPSSHEYCCGRCGYCPQGGETAMQELNIEEKNWSSQLRSVSPGGHWFTIPQLSSRITAMAETLWAAASRMGKWFSLVLKASITWQRLPWCFKYWMSCTALMQAVRWPDIYVRQRQRRELCLWCNMFNCWPFPVPLVYNNVP